MAAKHSIDYLPHSRLDSLDDDARTLFHETLINERWPVAVVGSGMSIVYGGVTWARSVEIGLQFATRRIKEVKDALDDEEKLKNPRVARLKHLLFRQEAAVTVYLDLFKPDHWVSPADLYVAMDTCEETLDFLDTLVADRDLGLADTCSFTSDGGKERSTFRHFYHKLFKDDSLVLKLTLAKRFLVSDFDRDCIALAKSSCIDPKKIRDVRESLFKLDDRNIQQLASMIYSVSYIRDHSTAAGDGLVLDKIEEQLRERKRRNDTDSDNILPMDRRSLLQYCLSTKSLEQRIDLLNDALKALEAWRSSGDPVARPPPRPLLDPIRSLQESLSVRRFVTLNFDLQLENALMLDDMVETSDPPHGLQPALDSGRFNYDIDSGDRSGGVFRRFPDGLAAASEIYTEDGAARVFEFALDSPDYRFHVLHLHGRADRPDNMLLTESDGNRQYRRDRLRRRSLERALDVALTGNPVLFVGIALSEPEITRALHELVSRGDVRRDNPAFAILAPTEGGTAAFRQQASLLRRFGVRVLFDGMPDKPDEMGLADIIGVLKQLRTHLRDIVDESKHSCGSTYTSDDRLSHKISQLLCEDLVMGLWIDAAVFTHLLGAANDGTRRQHEWVLSAVDYIESIEEKVRALAVHRTVVMLRDDISTRAAKTDVVVAKRREWALKDQYGNAPQFARDRAPWEASIRYGAEPKITSGQYERPKDAMNTACQAHWPLVTIFSPLGSGKGMLVQDLTEILKSKKTPFVSLNCSFGLEFDSAVIRLLYFMAAWSGVLETVTLGDRFDQLRKILAKKRFTYRPCVIIISGIDRMMESEGEPIAPDFELLLRLLISPALRDAGFRLVLVGAPGCRRFVANLIESAALAGRWCDLSVDAEHAEISTKGLAGHIDRLIRSQVDLQHADAQRGVRALHVARQWASTLPAAAMSPNGARSRRIEVTLSLVLERWHELAFGRYDADATGRELARDRLKAELDKAILGALAMVATPIEISVVVHLVDCRKLLDALVRPEEQFTKLLADSVARLSDWGLVRKIDKYAGSDGAERVVLHRSVLAVMRHRVGIRVGDALLSNSFGLTVALSMPSDLSVPDWDVLMNIKDVIGRLRGAWRDVDLSGVELEGGSSIAHVIEELRTTLLSKEDVDASFEAGYLPRTHQLSVLARHICMAWADLDVTLRAAAAIVRGYLSAACLVAQAPPAGHSLPDGAPGQYGQHRRQLRSLVDTLIESQCAASLAEASLERLAVSVQNVPRLAASVKILQTALQQRNAYNEKRPAALYGGEIIWLINERGVIALLQGDLYEAARAFIQAQAAIRKFRSTTGDISSRRLAINRAFLRIERGRIAEARHLLEDNGRPMSYDADGRLRPAYWAEGTLESRRIAPLIEAYMALCDHLEGRLDPALRTYESAIAGLQATRQHRALAVTHIRFAELLRHMGRKREMEEHLRLGLITARAGSQLDILWRGQLIELHAPAAEDGLPSPPRDMRQARIRLGEARRYALLMDLPRLQVQSHRIEADILVRAGDLEGAEQAAAEAMTLARRYGMTLQRIGLRSQMGEILARRGDPSGRTLIERAIDHADRIGFQLQVMRAQKALAELDLAVPSGGGDLGAVF